MPAPFVTAAAQRQDIPVLVRFRKEISRHSQASNGEVLMRSEEAWAALPDQYETWIEDPNVCFRVARMHDGVIGMAIGHDIRVAGLMPAHLGEISDAWVESAHRKQGVALALVDDLARFFVERSVDRVVLDFVVGNIEAEQFWLSLGVAPMVLSASSDTARFAERVAQRRDRLP